MAAASVAAAGAARVLRQFRRQLLPVQSVWTQLPQLPAPHRVFAMRRRPGRLAQTSEDLLLPRSARTQLSVVADPHAADEHQSVWSQHEQRFTHLVHTPSPRWRYGCIISVGRVSPRAFLYLLRFTERILKLAAHRPIVYAATVDMRRIVDNRAVCAGLQIHTSRR